ncbi:putative F-box domain, FBD domain, leucine-rich repeat domain, L domain-containing protein [Rosa chinensis]|uniref:Putative F-box domain, FBD domain, leucine-rich repeat domain, L domain-containing protein n=1 Tax=Rosa chinensis TaxID=74649 RepID=A0A2P6S4D5_ROSCH|nr:putative FBD-associated F-box protein At1g61330 [Rosa chinensis]PRQ53541.1 putative F-box domain, FBD domain, leucine-rich repeat domain, L domain-containing protein [Rosa chinensis]
MECSGIIAKVEGERKDWIEKLPCSVLSYILSFLTIKDAVGTCMISRQWRHLWKHPILTRTNLEFDIPNVFGGKRTQHIEELEEDNNRLEYYFHQFEREFFVRWVNEFLLLYRGKEVDSFKVAFFLDAESTAVLDKWVHFAIKKGAEILNLKLLRRGGTLDTENVYVFPHWLLSELKASTLKHLSLQRCVLKPPPDFDRFIQLTTLCLNKAIVDPVFLAHLFSVCLLLESLTLRYCRLGSYLTIGPSLRLNDLKVLLCVNLERIEIDAVNLSSLEYSGNHLQISCMRIPRLVRYFFSGSSKGALPYALTLLASCPGLETLHFQIWNNLEAIPQTVSTFRNLKQVNLDLFMPNFDLWSILNFLKAAPLLEEFIVTVQPSNYQGDARNLPEFSHDHLRIFKMQGFQGKWIEIEFAICILRIATKLELLVIDPLGKYYNGGGMWSKVSCYYVEGNENEVIDEHEEDGVDWHDVNLQYLCWKQRASLVVRERLKEVMTDAQVIIL